MLSSMWIVRRNDHVLSLTCDSALGCREVATYAWPKLLSSSDLSQKLLLTFFRNVLYRP